MKLFLLNNNRYLILILMMIIGAALLVVRQQFIRWYDPEFLLQEGNPVQMNYTGSTMVVYIDQSCPCNAFSNSHLAALREKFQSSIKQELWLDNQELTAETKELLAKSYQVPPGNIRNAPKQWRKLIPSTPSVLLFNQDGSLGYVGPASPGLSCNSKSSFIDSLLANLTEGTRLQGIVNASVKGCFCDR